MSHDPTRKRFLAKVLGLGTLGAFAPRALASTLVPASTNQVTGPAAAFQLRPQPRAVARREGAA